MPSGDFDVLLRTEARRFFEGLNEADQAEVERLISLLQLDPWIDATTKFAFPSQVVVLTVYDDGRWVTIYRLLHNTVIHIWAIERADPARRRRRRY